MLYLEKLGYDVIPMYRIRQFGHGLALIFLTVIINEHIVFPYLLKRGKESKSKIEKIC